MLFLYIYIFVAAREKQEGAATIEPFNGDLDNLITSININYCGNYWKKLITITTKANIYCGALRQALAWNMKVLWIGSMCHTTSPLEMGWDHPVKCGKR